MNSNYDAFLESVVELHKKLAGKSLGLQAYAFYMWAIQCNFDQQVQAEFLYLKAIDLWLKSAEAPVQNVFNSVREFADDLARQYESLGTMGNVIPLDRARKELAA